MRLNVSGLTEGKTYVLGVGQGHSDAFRFSDLDFLPWYIDRNFLCALLGALTDYCSFLMPLSKLFNES